MNPSTRRSHLARLTAAVFAAAVFAASAHAQGAAAHGDTLTLVVPGAGSTASDSAAHANPLRSPGALTRLMAEADSAVKRQGGPRADNAQLFLSWNAPWGDRRAVRTRMPACADSVARDTLYLSFTPGRSAERFTGFTGQLFFRATGSDSLGAWWHMESKGGENPGNMLVQWSSAEGFPGTSPFRVPGQGFVILDHTSAVARLRMVFAVPYEGAGPVVPNAVYSLGRIILSHHPARALAGCGQPMVLEWGVATLAFGPKDEPSVHRGERFVTWGGPWSLVEPFRGPHVEAWRPKTPDSRTPDTK